MIKEASKPQFENAFSPIKTRDPPRIKSALIEEQFAKEKESIDCKEFGKLRCCNWEQFAKAEEPIDLSDSEN
jgi:hypothetical protein